MDTCAVTTTLPAKSFALPITHPSVPLSPSLFPPQRQEALRAMSTLLGSMELANR